MYLVDEKRRDREREGGGQWCECKCLLVVKELEMAGSK
jgi:hypothetical protein